MAYVTKAPYYMDPQKTVEHLTGYRSLEESLPFTVDAVWLETLVPTEGFGSWASQLLPDIIIAWEVDSSPSHKAIRSSIDNLARANPKLGIEWILVGGNTKTIKNFEGRFRTATQAARQKTTRIIVIHDIIFSYFYFKATGKHPLELYEVYVNLARNNSDTRNMIVYKWEELLGETKTDKQFNDYIHEIFLSRI